MTKIGSRVSAGPAQLTQELQIGQAAQRAFLLKTSQIQHVSGETHHVPIIALFLHPPQTWNSPLPPPPHTDSRVPHILGKRFTTELPA